MSMVEYYEIALDSLEESAKVYKEIDSPELYGDALLDLTRYAFLAQKPEKAVAYASEAIDYSLANAALLLTDSELVSSVATIEAIIRTKIQDNFTLGAQCLETLKQLYIPNKKEAAKLEKIAAEIKRMSEDTTLISSKKVSNLAEEIQNFIQKKQFISIIEHEAQEKERAIKEALDRQIALAKAEKEKQEKEKKQAEKKEQQLLFEKQEQEENERQERLADQEWQEKLRKSRIAAKQNAIERRKKIFTGIAVIFIIIIGINFFRQNRTRYESLDGTTFQEKITQPHDKFISYFFIFNDTDIRHVRALPNRNIKVPENSEHNDKYLVSLWSTEIAESGTFSLKSISSSLPVTDEGVQTALPGEKIRMSTTNRVYFPILEPAIRHIVFNGNGVKGLKKEVEVPYSSQFQIPNPIGPTPEGLEFLGWSSSKTGNPKTAYQPGQFITMPATDFNLYALWASDNPVLINPTLATITFPGLFLTIIIGALLNNILLVRFIILVIGILLGSIAVMLFNEEHPFWGLFFLYLALSTLVWGCIPNLYLMMMIISLW